MIAVRATRDRRRTWTRRRFPNLAAKALSVVTGLALAVAIAALALGVVVTSTPL